VSPIEVMHLKFYSEYHWVVDYTVYATIVYVATEVRFTKNKNVWLNEGIFTVIDDGFILSCVQIYYAISTSQTETNLSVYWCLLVLGLCL
jgi:hypothetical protein